MHTYEKLLPETVGRQAGLFMSAINVGETYYVLPQVDDLVKEAERLLGY
jgi:hypothetical protein